MRYHSNILVLRGILWIVVASKNVFDEMQPIHKDELLKYLELEGEKNMELSKVVKKRYINKSINVITRKDLADALNERYSSITVEGDLGVRLYKEMNGFSSKQEVADQLFAKIFDTSSLKVLTKLLKDYKMVSSSSESTVIVLKDSAKGFEKK